MEQCAGCGRKLEQGGGFSVLSKYLDRPLCPTCRKKLSTQFAGALAVLGLGVALSPVLVNMPVGLFVLLGGGLVLIAGLVFWRARRETAESSQSVSRWLPGRLAPDAEARFHVAIFGTWLLAYYVANLACGEWNPLSVGCNSTCKGIMWGSLGSMAALSTAYVMGYRKVAWLMLGVTVVQNYPHCQCENGFYIAALQVQPFCLIVPTMVGLVSLWMLEIRSFKPLGYALTLSLLAGAFAVAATHRLGIPIVWRIVV